jgi:soluble lytic murein transglycosylase
MLGGVMGALRLLFPLHYWSLLEENGNRYQIDPLLLAAVIRAESKFFPQAKSEKGALGLMQIIPDTGAWAASKIGLIDFEIDKLYDPAVNIQIGSWYLCQLLHEFDGQTVVALAAYNSGRGHIRRWLESKQLKPVGIGFRDLPYLETRSYVQKVLRNYYCYQQIYRSKEKVIGDESRNRN